MSEIDRPLNVVLRPGSPAHTAYMTKAGAQVHGGRAPGFHSDKKDNLKYFGGKTITDLVFTNRYLGGPSVWHATDMKAIDHALALAMSDAGLETIVQQYFKTPISSKMLPSKVVPGAVGPKFFKDDVEHMAEKLAAEGALGTANPDNTVICMMLPPGVVLVDDFSPGSTPSGSASEREHRGRHTIRIDDDAADSKHGLGGFHGSIHPKNGPKTIYYAVAVFSDGDNGIPFFAAPWKNVVATHYHELNEARTDADVEDVIRGGPDSLIGWYSPKEGEIGDIPINVASSLGLVMQEIKLADGSETVPVQLMWSNKVGGPAEP
jgi:hypothetical protein